MVSRRKVKAGIAALLMLGLALPVFADLEAAKEAYQRRDYQQALAEFLPLAEQGDSDAQVYAGLMYATGRGTEKDLLTAARWYRLAADQGHRDAQFNLGPMYAKGLGVPMNYAAAVRLYREAADRIMPQRS
jgi:TPR repeat protein